jgi:hypothetical protein
MQNVFRTCCGPQDEQLMVGVCKRPSSADGDEARVAVFREDHGCTPFKLSKKEEDWRTGRAFGCMLASPILGFPGFFPDHVSTVQH